MTAKASFTIAVGLGHGVFQYDGMSVLFDRA